ncbi:MAG: 2-C-methyl-D-erythritol 4-phosphate cytidylyltransferase [Neisseriaceae bacterium]|nr:MAG: 2-C-methyl-D-erythritol 4-phosphate cytidylyltransferase [Neisseriaceae bacterium]
MKNKQRTIALIPAAGVGTRFGASMPKQYVCIHKIPVLLHTLQCLSIPQIEAIYIVLSPTDEIFTEIKIQYKDFLSLLLHQEDACEFSWRILTLGGVSRAHTVRNALEYLKRENLVEEHDWILVHDAVRCCLPHEYLYQLIKTVHVGQQGAILAQRVMDTVKKVGKYKYIQATLNRDYLWLAQTPQMFLLKDLLKAYEQVSELDKITDEASLLEVIGKPVLIVNSDTRNFKITTLQDMHYAEYLLSNKSE